MLSLPDDILFLIFAYCQPVDLAKMCRVCKRFRNLASSDCLWIRESRRSIVASSSNQLRWCGSLSVKEKCRLSFNWVNDWKVETALSKYRVRYMPWLSLNGERLWVAEGDRLKAFRHVANGRFSHKKPVVNIRSYRADICRFVINDDIIITGESDGTIQGWCEETGSRLFRHRDCHREEVSAVDSREDAILTGSRDRSLKLWTLSSELIERKCIDLKDRIWSLALNPNMDTFVCGTSGCRESPLLVFDTASGRNIGTLGSDYLHGAGVLCCVYDSPQCLMTGGYDTYIRQWDTRTQSCSLRWENPYDLTVYCLASDNSFTFLSGSSDHGLVWLWDKRSSKPVQHYYVGHYKSPVYSLAFDPCHMYVALDLGIHLQDFRSYYTATK